MLKELERERAEVLVEGARIAYRSYGDPQAPTLLLVHGGGAHGAWFTGMIPFLASTHHLVVPDLSGHGDSDRRAGYTPSLWAAEMAAVIEDAGADRTSVVGHSMGGFVTTYLLAEYAYVLDAAVIIDTSFREPAADGKRPRWRKMRRPSRVYPSFGDALARFRLVPDQPVTNPDLVDVIARASITEVADGWTWKSDPQVYGRFDDREIVARLATIETPLAYLYGEHSSLCDTDSAAFLSSVTPADVVVEEIPRAHHHVVIDRPRACADAVKRFFSQCVDGADLDRG